MAEQEIIPNPGGNPIDLTATPVYLSNMIVVYPKNEGVILTFLRNEKPYAVCVARVAVPNNDLLGLLKMLAETAKAKGIDVQALVALGESEKGPSH